MQTTIKVSFILTGIGVKPDKITKFIGIIPTKTWRMGEKIQNSSLKRKQDGWCLSSKETESIDLNYEIEKLINIILPAKKKIVEICEKYQIESEISCVVNLHGNETPAINLKKATIKNIYELDSSIDIDLYVFD